MKPFVFNTTQSIINESGALNNIADICCQQHMSKPLIVTDQGIVSVGLMAKLEEALQAGGWHTAVIQKWLPAPLKKLFTPL
jgi:alcohol dehydrogenase